MAERDSFIRYSIFSLPLPIGFIGFIIVSLSGVQFMKMPFLGSSLNDPSMANGTTSICVMSAMTNAPFLNSPKRPVRVRVPSAKMPIAVPFFKVFTALTKISFGGDVRFTNMWPVS